MSAWTNVDTRYSDRRRQLIEFEKLKLERDEWLRAYDELLNMLCNIPRAIEQYGYCDLQTDDGIMRVVKNSVEPTLGSEVK